MTETIEALFDGVVLRPTQPLALKPNTRVWIVVETTPPATQKPLFFAQRAPSTWKAPQTGLPISRNIYMETSITMRHRVFLDAAYAIALSVPRDQYHQRAVSLADELETSQTRLITTRAVLLEIGNAFQSSAIGKRQ